MSKNSNFKRITAFMLALIMIVGALPASVFASEGETTTSASYTLDVSSLEKPSSRAYVAGIDVSGPKVKTVNNVNAKEYTANTTDGTNFDIVLAYGTAQDATITINFTKGGTSSQQKKLTFASDYLSGDTTATIQLAEGKAEAVVKSSYTFGKTEEADWKFAFSIQETEDVFVPVESVSLDKQEIKLIPNQETTLTATVSPKTATNDTVTWTSSDQTVATVENGKVKAKAYGTTTITATAEEKSATCTVTVEPNIAVSVDGTAIELTPYESGSAAGNGYLGIVPVGKDITVKGNDVLSPVITGYFGGGEIWKSVTKVDDNTITITADQIWNMLGTKEAFISDTSEGTIGKYPSEWLTDNSHVFAVNIYYDVNGSDWGYAVLLLEYPYKYAESIAFEKEAYEVEAEKTLQLNPIIEPAGTTDRVSWVSTDERYATVDQNGLVTAIKPGNTTIEATINGFTASCEVKVVEAVPELIVTANGTPLEVQKNANGEYFVKAQRGAEIVIEAGKGAVSQVLYPAGTVENGKGIVSGEALKTRTVDQLAPPPMVEQAKKDYGFEMTDFANELAIVDFSVEGEKLAKVLLVELIPNLQAIALDKTTLELSVGSTYQLTAAFTPADAADNHVVWDSESSLYASVDENGLVTANKPGTTVITAKVDDIVASCEVTVTDKITVPEGYYEVLLKADEGVTLEFFNGEEKITEGIYDKGVSDGVQQYIAVLPEGTYDFRGTQDGQKLGGMQFKVPVEDEYASDGTLMGKGNVVTLKRLNFYPNNTEFGTAGQYAVTIVPKDYDQAVAGEQYVDAGGYLITPVLINAAGNVTTYQIAIDILDTELVKKYGIDMLVNQTYGGTNAENIMLPVKKISYYSVTAPETAKVQAFKQINNFNVREVALAYSEKAEDGMIRYFYPSSSNMTYRVSQEGKITRAGFFGTGSSYTQGIVANEIVVTFNEKENPKTTNSTARRIENSSVLNVNAKNNLDLEVGGTFRLRAYRAAWEIINTDTANIMIEPDFHYEILAGEDVIDVKTVTDVCTGNATGNWMDITGLKEGIAIIEVSYDAIIIGGNTQYTGQFGATEESRKSLVVVEVGGTGEHTLEVTSTHGTHEKYVWDVDLSTVYMFGDKTDFTFTAEINESQPDKVEYTTDDGKTWKTATKDGENYTVKDLLAGNNIIKVTKGDNVEYQVVRVTKASVTIKNLTRPGDKTIIVGDTITVHFNNVYDPTPKMSGIYNPGFSGATTTKYTVNNPEGVTYSATSKQYGFATDNLMTIKFTEAGTFTFADGYIDSHVMGNPSGEHRSLTDTGCGTNFNARNGDSNRGVLPDLEFTVIEDPTVLLEIRSNPSGAKVEIEGYEPNEDGYFELNYGTYRYKLTLEGYVPVKGSVVIAGDDYLLDGTKVVLVDMTKIDEDTIWDGKHTVRPKKDENGVWLISNGYEFAGYAKFGEGQDAKLTADISLGGFGITAPLSGTFDGNGHWIRDFYHNDSLFSLSADGAVVKNLGVEGEVDTTQGSAGAIVRSNTKTVTLENVVSYVDFNYTGETYLTTSGGLVGEASGCTIINCYNAGRMYTRFGGAGSISMSGASVQNSYSIGFNSSSDSYGVIKSGGTVKNNYALENTAKNPGGSFMSEADMKKADFAETLGSAYLYNPTSYNDGYPILTWEESRALEVALKEFVPEIENYKDHDDYLDAQKAELSAAIKAGKETLAAATTLEEAIKALNDAKAAMDKIRTAADFGDESEDDQTADVYFSLSHDDKFVFAEASGTVMALQNIKVPYFDLALYGLEKYYFVSESYDQGGQVGGNIGNASSAIYNGKVTMLHLFIYATEVYYLGLDPEDAGKGYLYEAGLVGTEIFEPTQSAGSMYMKHLWGMDENFNYYYNYAYPLASEGWGSTADQILLHDGDVVTIGHFTSWNFHLDDMSVFNYIKDGDKIISTSAKQGEAVELTVLLAAKGGNYTTAHLPMANRGVYISPIDEMTNNTTQWQFIGTSDENGKIVVLTDDLEPGKYIIGTPGQKGIQYKTEICSTPGAIYLTVEDTVHTHTFGNWNIVKDAKCNEYGEKVRYCSYCPAYETENIDVLAHTPKVVGAIEATCAKPGYTGDTVCDVCDSRLATGKVVDKLAHTEVAIEGKDATCTEAGLTEGKKCTVCGTVTVAQEEIAALGHKEEVLQGKAATCTEAGLTEGKKCTVCGTVTVAQEEIAALGHKEEIIPGKPATETETGLTEGKKCSVCGEIIVKQEEIPVLEKEYTLGDVNGDGKVNALDATQILRYANNKASVLSGVEEDTALYKAADVNADGKINALDATQILRYANNKASVFDK